MCRKEQIVPIIGKQKTLARSKHIQMHYSNILEKETWQEELLAFYYLYHHHPQGDLVAPELLRPVPEHLDLLSTSLFSKIMFCKKGTVKNMKCKLNILLPCQVF